MQSTWCLIFSAVLLTMLCSGEPDTDEEVCNLQLVNKLTTKDEQASLVVENQTLRRFAQLAEAYIVANPAMARAMGMEIGFQAAGGEEIPMYTTPDNEKKFELDKSAFPADGQPTPVPEEGQTKDWWAGYGLRLEVEGPHGKLIYDRTRWQDFIDMSALIRGVTECEEDPLVDGASESDSELIKGGFAESTKLLSGATGERLLQSYAAHLPYSALTDIFSLSLRLSLGTLPHKTLAERILQLLERFVVQKNDNGWPHFQEDALGFRDPPGLCASIFDFKPGQSKSKGIDQTSSNGFYYEKLKEYPWCCAVLRLEFEPDRWPYCAFALDHLPITESLVQSELLQTSSNSTRLMPGMGKFFSKLFQKTGEGRVAPYVDEDGPDPIDECHRVVDHWREQVAAGDIEKDDLKDVFDSLRKDGLDCCEHLGLVMGGPGFEVPLPVFTRPGYNLQRDMDPRALAQDILGHLDDRPIDPKYFLYHEQTTWPCDFDDATFKSLEAISRAAALSQCAQE